MHIAYHHIVKNGKKVRLHNTDGKNISFAEDIMNKLVYLSAFFGVLVNIPQLITIWVDKRIDGVSLTTWIGFLIGSFFWFMYGVIHKEKPIIVANLFFMVIQGLIVLGLLT